MGSLLADVNITDTVLNWPTAAVYIALIIGATIVLVFVFKD